jgi:hypothetical protein
LNQLIEKKIPAVAHHPEARAGNASDFPERQFRRL